MAELLRRYLADQIRTDLDRKMVFVSGPRQVGKTTLARGLLPDPAGYLSWDIPDHRDAILRGRLPNAPMLVFDELHKFQGWRGFLKGLYDRHDGTRILVTGSGRLDYYRYGDDSLQGRYHLLRLHPLSVAELGVEDAGGLDRLLDLGGFPEPWTSDSRDAAKRWSREYRMRMVEEDIRDMEEVADISAIELLAVRLTDLVGEAVAAPPPPVSLEAWSGEADAFHAVRVARAGVSVAEAGIDRAEAAWRPNWGVQLTYQQRDHPGDDWVSATATFTVPFWADGSQAPALRAAEAEREAARSRVMAAARRASARYLALDATRAAAEAGIAILEEKIDAIRDQIAAQLTTYESGTGDYSPILGGDIAVLQLQGQIVDEQAGRDRAVVRMNALLAGP